VDIHVRMKTVEKSQKRYYNIEKRKWSVCDISIFYQLKSKKKLKIVVKPIEIDNF
jgi:hypothetical protein